MAPYNRKAAVDYARLHWNVPCKNGIVDRINMPQLNTKKLTSPGPKFSLRFKPFGTEPENLVWTDGSMDISAHPWDGLGDCAHFLSDCLVAGGANIQTSWVPSFPGLLQASKQTKLLGRRLTEARAKEVVSTGIMQPGDMICYYDFTGTELGGGYVHSAIFTATDEIACHTISRFGSGWNLHPDRWHYTLFHFHVDDNARVLLKPLAPALKGWWKVTWRGGTFYYLFTENGSVSWTSKKPASTKNGMAVPDATGSWFGNPGTSTFFIVWPNSGSVERFTLDAAAGTITGTWNQGVENERISGVKM